MAFCFNDVHPKACHGFAVIAVSRRGTYLEDFEEKGGRTQLQGSRS
jgi:hypothetical protein